MKTSRRLSGTESGQPVLRPTANSKKSADKNFPIVGVGASAGGLEAFTQLLNEIPKKSGLAFVLVQHLAPTHESALTELLRRATKLAVTQVKDGVRVKPDCVYVIPPNVNMGIKGGRLHLIPRPPTQPHMPIDFLLRSLAEEQGTNAIGVVLSGTASDGCLGVKAIKGEGGVTFAQDPATARYSDMPRNAIATGYVDFVLPPEGIARELTRIATHPYLLHGAEETVSQEAEDGLRRIFILLRTATGVDFSDYKHTTIKRRIKRRMMLHKMQSLKEYVESLMKDRRELDALYQDVLIHVTGFFRDPEAFQALKSKVFPILFKNRSAQNPVRIWVPGCSTGEEVYSLAMSVGEYAGDTNNSPEVQIFATDISEPSLERARTGTYLENIAAEVSPERLRRFFVKTVQGYTINKAIRDICVFARQDVTRDPSFSRVDLISCRNLLIYLSTPLHKRILPVFHYALKPNGFLLLGASETIGGFSDLFALIDKKNKIYSRKTSMGRAVMDFARPGLPTEKREPEKPSEEIDRRFDIQKEADRVLLNRYCPPGVLVNSSLEIMQFRGRTGAFLEPPAGQPSLSLVRMAREGLLVDLRQAIDHAKKDDTPYTKRGVIARVNGRAAEIDIEVLPLKSPSVMERFYLVMFKEVDHLKPEKRVAAAHPRRNPSQYSDFNRAERLKLELAQTKSTLQSIIEEQETTNEELKSANEEILSSNEELQSTNEELETAKEELQSTNEELNTLNDELRSRNAELGTANNDLLNLMASINIPMLMLSNDLHIRHFTPPAEGLLNLIASDVGRPISDLKPNLELDNLAKMITSAIENLTVQASEVRDRHGRWYSMTIRPYRTSDNKLDGAVVTWLDITALKVSLEGAEKALGEASEQYRLLFERNLAGIFRAEVNGTVVKCNAAFAKMLGYDSPAEAARLRTADLCCSPYLLKALVARLNDARRPANLETQLCRKDRKVIWVLLNAAISRRTKDPSGDIEGVVLDISDRKQAEESLRQLSGRLLESQEEERKRISRELHGATASNLTAIVANLATALKGSGLDKRLRSLMAESLRLTKRCLSEIRTVSYLLHPPMLEEMGLPSALRWYAEGFERRSGVKLDLDIPTELNRLPKPVEIAVFRVVQESLTNIHFHSQSPTARIRLLPVDNHLTVEVTDEGIGLAASAAKDSKKDGDNLRIGVGIAGMRERTMQLGGRFEIVSEDKGTTVRAILPIPAPGVPALPPPRGLM